MNGVDETPGAEGSSTLGAQRAHAAVGRVWFAHGPRAAELSAVLAALAPGACAVLADLYELPPSSAASAGAETLIVDADHFALEDIGWIRRQLSTGRLGAVVALGMDPGAAVARALRGLPATRWAQWPPDLEELKRWGAPNSASRASEFLPRALPTAARPASQAAPSSAAEPVEGEAPTSQVQRAPSSGTSAAQPVETGAAARLPLALGRDQVAVLADISQRLELAFLALREAGRGQPSELQTAQVELRRLLRFTRSLACLAAPPPRGDDEFDVASLLEELLATLTLRGRKGPRFQPTSGAGGRPAVEFVARADRAAVTMALETVLTLARLCSSGGDTVRVSYAPVNGSSLSIAVDFPAGPLHDVEPGRVLDPGLLRERLPELDPSELAAATAILHSQGGRLEFASAGEGQLSARLRLPLERTPQRSAQRAPQAGVLQPVEAPAARANARAESSGGSSASGAVGGESAARAGRGSSRGDDPFA